MLGYLKIMFLAGNAVKPEGVLVLLSKLTPVTICLARCPLDLALLARIGPSVAYDLYHICHLLSLNMDPLFRGSGHVVNPFLAIADYPSQHTLFQVGIKWVVAHA